MSKKDSFSTKEFMQLLEDVGLPLPETEYMFHPERKWRMDYAWPEHKIALEVEGGIFIGGRHSRGMGMKNDFDKYNEAAIYGWRIIKVVPNELLTRKTLTLLRRIILLN